MAVEKTLTVEQQIGGVEASPDSYTIMDRLKDIASAVGGGAVERAESTQDLSTAALDFTTSISEKFKLQQVFLRASVAITALVEIFFVSKTNATYTTKLASANLVGERDLYYAPDYDMQFEDGDEVKVTCSQNGGVGVVYVTVMGVS